MAALALPATAGASVDARGAQHAYARARLADSAGAQEIALANYRQALAEDPTNTDIARRSYFQALESGDPALAERSAALLDGQGMLPRDGVLLRIAQALTGKDWGRARTLCDRLVGEGNFAFLAPIIRSWISIGEGRYEPAVLDASDRFAPLARRYLDEHVAFQALGRGDIDSALSPLRRSLSLRTNDLAAMRLAFAGQLAARGRTAEALSLLPADQASFALARADIAAGRKPRGSGAALTPAQGFARLLARLAMDVSADNGMADINIRLARIATFADPAGPEVTLIAAHLLTQADLADDAILLARKAPANGWYGALARAELVDALAASGATDQAIALARALASAPGAETQRHVRLGQLLSDRGDFAGAAAAFHAAQGAYPADNAPWALLLFEGSALEQAGQWAQARAILERALQRAPEEPMVLNYLGYAQIQRRENVKAAFDLLKKASALKPQDPSITDSLGWAQYVTGNVGAAVPALERAVAGAPTDPTINEHLGDALWAAGRRYEARYAWAAAAIVADGAAATRLTAKAREGMKPEYAAP
jgi:Flp pilus assembly protein TadD